MNSNGQFWNQQTSIVTVMVTVGEGSQSKGLKDRNAILKEEKLGGNLRINKTCRARSA
jgi:hypothetical protein